MCYVKCCLLFLTGTQLWPDGSKYEGQFHNDLRHGQGEHKWANNEVNMFYLVLKPSLQQ